MIGLMWTGTDGSVWDLRTGPVRVTVAGMKGLGSPEFDAHTKETALLDGQRFEGFRAKPRTVWLPVTFKDAAAVDVEGLQRAFWRSMALGEVGTLTVTDGGGATRSLALRFQDDGGMAYRLDPYVLTDVVGVTMIADQPWWQGPPISSTYSLGQTDALLSFFGNGAGATPFNINRAQGSTTATLSNPGDVPAWLTWDVVGPASYVRLGVGGRYVATTAAVSAGKLLRIESDPLRQLAWLDGVKITRQLTEIDFAPVPKGADVPLSITITGTGSVTATLVPRYARAF